MHRQVGDVILVAAGDWSGRQMHDIPDVPDDRTVPANRVLADYFWRVILSYARKTYVLIRHGQVWSSYMDKSTH